MNEKFELLMLKIAYETCKSWTSQPTIKMILNEYYKLYMGILSGPGQWNKESSE